MENVRSGTEEIAMSVDTAVRIEYPESDGKPMGETDLHRDWIVRVIELLKHRYREEPVYVSGDLLIYYEEGNIYKFVVPDAFIVKQVDTGRRRTYKLWEEGKGPEVVFEITSRSTWRDDTSSKFDKFRLIGVREVFLYDPNGHCLDPRLQGYRLIRGDYERIEAEAGGGILSEELGARLNLDDGDLIVEDACTGERWQTAAEFEEAARQAAEAKAAELEAEIQRLREQLSSGKTEEGG
jgi:Uma2 family endonuclease